MTLPPADKLEESTYDMRKNRAPRLTGLALKLFVPFIESPFSSPLYAKLLRDSGIPQAVRDISVPEVATFLPAWEHLKAEQLQAANEEAVEHLAPRQRVDAAAQAVPGFSGKAAGEPAGQGQGAAGRYTAADYRRAYISGAATPSQVAEALFDAIAASEAATPSMRIFVAVDKADVRRQAAESSARYKAGKPLSALDGVPYAVKDDTDALPYSTTGGTTYMASIRMVTRDAALVASMRETGAMMIGKTAMVEHGLSAMGLNTRSGTPRNPYNPSHLTGGSSSGSAAAVSAGLCPFAIGTDGGGSVRIPASFCGLVGLMPTFGRDAAPTASSPPSCHTVGVTGQLGASVADTLLLYAGSANAGTLADCAGAPQPLAVPRALPSGAAAAGAPPALSGLRLGLFREWFEDADAEIVAMCHRAVALMVDRGAEVVELAVPELELARVAHVVIIGAEMALAHRPAVAVPALRRQMNKDIRVNLDVSKQFSATDYLQANALRTRAIQHCKGVFKKVDLLVTPAAAVTAPIIHPQDLKCGASDLTLLSAVMRFATLANLVGLPAISLPVGQDTTGLPVGLQLMGPAWSESQLLRVGAVLEAAVAGDLARPRVFYDILGAAARAGAPETPAVVA
ncbi:hypothetical protein WJX81_000884 [Elliptochloris bilobata]|uniref:Amidase domain-containing protein n=1 Tax=Elliptochloris bilobata TaxID=381761 RepID=A0AAW1RN76_9CHLO